MSSVRNYFFAAIAGFLVASVAFASAMALTVTAPASGSFLRPGGSIETAWTGADALGSADVSLWRGTNRIVNLAIGLPAAATAMTWRALLPGDLLPSAEYHILVEKSGIPATSATSAWFTVIAPWLVWQESTGELSCWQMDTNAGCLSTFDTSPGSSIWKVRAAGDLDGNGVSDIFLQSTDSGRITCRLMNADGTVKSNINIVAANGWIVAAAGDVDADGITDLVMRRSGSGSLACWFMNRNGSVRSSTSIFAGTTTLHVAGAGDVDGDGVADIILQEPGGQIVCWFLDTDGAIRLSSVVASGSTAGQVRAVVDTDGDGTADLFLQLATGETVCWFMNPDGSREAVATVSDEASSSILRCGCENAGTPPRHYSTIYVSTSGTGIPTYTSWGRAATNIQDALLVARPGDQVVVTDGTYTVSSPILATNAVTIRSVNGPAATILDSPNMDRCVSLSGGAIMSGFSVRCGAAWQGTTSVITNVVNGLLLGTGDGASTIIECEMPDRNINPGSLVVYGGAWLFVDNGDGTLSGTLGALGSIQYETGRVILDFQAAAPEPGFEFWADYEWLIPVGRLADATHMVAGEVMGYGDGSSTLLSGTVSGRNINPGTFTVGGGGWAFDDNGDGTLTGSPWAIGLVDYERGEWSLDFLTVAPDVGLSFNASYQWMSPNDGGGVFLGDGAMLTGCRVSGFWSEYGGGVTCSGITRVADCEVSGNFALYRGAGILCSTGTVVSGSSVVSNLARLAGGGVAYGVVSNCTVAHNLAHGSGGGLWDSVAYQCKVVANRAGASGGGAFDGEMESCLVSGNSAGSAGGGAYGGRVVNCTVVGNAAAAGSGGGTRDSLVRNSIVWSNTAGANVVGGSIVYSCAPSAPAGFRNITNAPGFVDYAVGNFRLDGSSMCINAGDNAAVAVGTDCEGNDRIRAAVVDMGGYESPYAPIDASAGLRGWISPSGRVSVVVGEGIAFAIGPNPAHLIDDVAVDGRSVGPTNRYEFVNIVTGHTIIASFSGHTEPGECVFSGAGLSEAGAVLSWNATNGWFYSLQKTPGLVPAAWSNVPGFENVFGLGQVRVTNLPCTAPAQFFRLKLTEAP
ncbi:MAG: VCBS repeat-containing protein [bacterium]